MGFIQDIKKAVVWQRRAQSYRGGWIGLADSITSNTALYYSLYRKNTDLRRCVEELYQWVNRDWYVLKKYNPATEEHEPFQDETIQEILNNQYPFDELIALMIRDLNIWGNVYLLKLAGSYDGSCIGLQVIDARTMKIVANKFGEVLWYVQQTRWTGGQKFTTDEIIHVKDITDHDNEIFGIGKVETLVYDMMWDQEASRSNYSYFKNNAVPSSLVVLDNELNPEEIELAMDQLKAQFSWGENAHRISAGIGIKDIKTLGNTLKDMEFTALRAFTTERICSATWVPKTILGYSDNVNFSTSDNQYRKFIENTIRPLRNKLQHVLTAFIQSLWDEYSGVSLEFVDTFEFDLDDKIARNEKLIGSGQMTINEARISIGQEKYDHEQADEPIIKQWYEFIEDIGVGAIANLPADAKQ